MNKPKIPNKQYPYFFYFWKIDTSDNIYARVGCMSACYEKGIDAWLISDDSGAGLHRPVVAIVYGWDGILTSFDWTEYYSNYNDAKEALDLLYNNIM